MWLIGAMVCLLAAPWVQLSVSAGNGWPHNALRHHWLMPVSCHFRDCKAPLVTSLTHVSGAITSVQTFIFTCPDQRCVCDGCCTNSLILYTSSFHTNLTVCPFSLVLSDSVSTTPQTLQTDIISLWRMLSASLVILRKTQKKHGQSHVIPY